MRQDVGRAGGAARTLRRVFGMTAIALVLSFIDAGVALAYTPPAWWQDGAAFAKKLNPDADCSLTTNDQGYTETGDKACYVDHVPYQGGLVSGGCDVGGYPDSGPLSVWCYFDMGSGQITDETCGRDGEASTEWRNEQGGGGAAIRAFTTFDKCAEAALSAARGDDAVPKPACSDGRDNDGDGKVDLGDPGCMDATDTDEADSPLRAIKTLKIIVDGPGTVQGGGGVCNRSVCEWKYRQGTTVLLSAVGVEPTNLAFRGWGGPSCVVQGSYCQVVLTSDSTVTARFDPVRTYAPEVMLHGDEKFFPGDPPSF